MIQQLYQRGKSTTKVQLRGNCNGNMAMNSRVMINEVTINETKRST
jgi:hypothetical protein